jgi:hypothetical protein
VVEVCVAEVCGVEVEAGGLVVDVDSVVDELVVVELAPGTADIVTVVEEESDETSAALAASKRPAV